MSKKKRTGGRIVSPAAMKDGGIAPPVVSPVVVASIPDGAPLVEVLEPVQYVKPGPPVLFVVWGTCGSYSDRNDWIVAMYEDEARAYEHARLAEQHVKALREKYEDASREDFHLGFPYDATVEEKTRYDLNEMGIRDDTYYYVSVAFVHQRPTAYQEELQVAVDKVREHGCWGNKYPASPSHPHGYLDPVARRTLARRDG